MIVEVFKTNVEEGYDASLLVEAIHHRFPALSANFDLDDCDRVLRVKSVGDSFHPDPIIHLLEVYGFHAEVLTDEIPVPVFSSKKLAFPLPEHGYRILDNC